ncbi:hypothetical protein HYV74_01630 [Candidatus Uhrbacteria bacterium]|nr:hypothetical protein [Candidatus Uhrbacteria bacterium]
MELHSVDDPPTLAHILSVFGILIAGFLVLLVVAHLIDRIRRLLRAPPQLHIVPPPSPPPRHVILLRPPSSDPSDDPPPAA